MAVESVAWVRLMVEGAEEPATVLPQVGVGARAMLARGPDVLTAAVVVVAAAAAQLVKNDQMHSARLAQLVMEHCWKLEVVAQ